VDGRYRRIALIVGGWFGMGRFATDPSVDLGRYDRSVAGRRDRQRVAAASELSQNERHGNDGRYPEAADDE
jgi:hypothetical protein